MGMLTRFFVAPRTGAQAILDGQTQGMSALELKSVDLVKLASLERVLGRVLGSDGRGGPTEMLSHKAGEAWVLLVPATLVDLLTRASEVAAEVGADWASTRELKDESWTAAEATVAVSQLAALACEARWSEKDVLVKLSAAWDGHHQARLAG